MLCRRKLETKKDFFLQSECSSYFTDIQKLLDAFKQKSGNQQTMLENIKKKIEMTKGISTVMAKSRPCPHCGVPIQKISG